MENAIITMNHGQFNQFVAKLGTLYMQCKKENVDRFEITMDLKKNDITVVGYPK